MMTEVDLRWIRNWQPQQTGNNMNIVQYLYSCKYIEGVHCGNQDCYACGTQRYHCDELEKLDKEND